MEKRKADNGFYELNIAADAAIERLAITCVYSNERPAKARYSMFRKKIEANFYSLHVAAVELENPILHHCFTMSLFSPINCFRNFNTRSCHSL